MNFASVPLAFGGANGQSRPPETAAVWSGGLSLSCKSRLRGRDLFLVWGTSYAGCYRRTGTLDAIHHPKAMLQIPRRSGRGWARICTRKPEAAPGHFQILGEPLVAQLVTGSRDGAVGRFDPASTEPYNQRCSGSPWFSDRRPGIGRFSQPTNGTGRLGSALRLECSEEVWVNKRSGRRIGANVRRGRTCATEQQPTNRVAAKFLMTPNTPPKRV